MFWNKTDALELIEMTYSVLDEDGDWRHLFDRIERLFGEAKFALQMWDESISVDHDQMILSGWDSGSITEYMDHYSNVNPFLPLIRETRNGAVFQGKDLIPTRTTAQLEFHNDFRRPNGIDEFVGATIFNEDSRTGALAIDGPAHPQQDWDELEALVRVLNPHMQRVMQLTRQLQDLSLHRSIADVALDRIGASMLIVDPRGHMKFASSSAMRLMSGAGVLRIGAGGYVGASTLAQTRKLKELIMQSTRGDFIGAESSGGFMMLETPQSQRMAAMVAPLRRSIQKRVGLADSWSANREYAVIILADPDSQLHLPSELLALRYDLTKKETQLALYLHEGGTLADYCDTNFVTLNTARTQLKSVFRKTGVSHQGGLVALLNRMSVFGERTG